MAKLQIPGSTCASVDLSRWQYPIILFASKIYPSWGGSVDYVDFGSEVEKAIVPAVD
jgi:hypothetical protein